MSPSASWRRRVSDTTTPREKYVLNMVPDKVSRRGMSRSDSSGASLREHLGQFVPACLPNPARADENPGVACYSANGAYGSHPSHRTHDG